MRKLITTITLAATICFGGLAAHADPADIQAAVVAEQAAITANAEAQAAYAAKQAEHGTLVQQGQALSTQVAAAEAAGALVNEEALAAARAELAELQETASGMMLDLAALQETAEGTASELETASTAKAAAIEADLADVFAQMRESAEAKAVAALQTAELETNLATALADAEASTTALHAAYYEMADNCERNPTLTSCANEAHQAAIAWVAEQAAEAETPEDATGV